MIPSYFKIEILAIRGEFVTLGHKGLMLTVQFAVGVSSDFPSLGAVKQSSRPRHASVGITTAPHGDTDLSPHLPV